MKMYGIKNCNSIKKAKDWLNGNQIAFDFHDYKTAGISKAKLQEWNGQVGWETLINKKGTTWRKLDDATKEKVNDETSAIDIMALHTSMIKRPVIENNGKIVAVGFNEEEYARKFNMK